jgi:NADH-quinone oxidoreductase subunit E
LSQQQEQAQANDLLTPESRVEIDRWVAKYPPEWKQSAVMAALRVAQDQNGGWLTNELIEAVASYLDMPSVAAYEVATFYAMYELEPVGRHKICVCNSISCLLNGSEAIVEHLKEKLGVGLNEVTPDGKFSIKEVECLGACVNAPMFMIGKTYHEDLTPEKIDRILDELE